MIEMTQPEEVKYTCAMVLSIKQYHINFTGTHEKSPAKNTCTNKELMEIKTGSINDNN